MQSVSIILPLYKSERFIRQTVESVLAQTYRYWDLIVIDDGSPDASGEICRSFGDPRIRVFELSNTGPCRARNYGITQATGTFLAFLDHDDIWLPEKLARHVAHLNARPDVGVSYGPSEFIDVGGRPLGLFQVPKLTGIDARTILCRNPPGNGSVPVARREVFEAVAFEAVRDGQAETMYFDDEIARWEDIELWIRIVTRTDWQFEGIPDCLTRYRIVPGSVAGAPDEKQAAFELGLEKIRNYAPDLVEQHGAAARAFHLRLLARRQIEAGKGREAVVYINRAIGSFPGLLIEDPRRTLVTIGAAYLLFVLRAPVYGRLQNAAISVWGRLQRRHVK